MEEEYHAAFPPEASCSPKNNLCASVSAPRVGGTCPGADKAPSRQASAKSCCPLARVRVRVRDLS